MERHPLIFLAVIITLGIIQGTCLGLLLRLHHDIDKLVEATRGVMSNLAELIEAQYEPAHRDKD